MNVARHIRPPAAIAASSSAGAARSSEGLYNTGNEVPYIIKRQPYDIRLPFIFSKIPKMPVPVF